VRNLRGDDDVWDELAKELELAAAGREEDAEAETTARVSVET